VLLVRGLKLDAAGFALGTSVCGWLNLCLLWPGLHSRLKLPKTQAGFFTRLGKMLVATLVCASAAWLTRRLIGGSNEVVGLRAVVALSASIAAAVVAYAGASAALGLEEWRNLRERFVRRRA
jgi:peptidoglycan biosynthesis protein MviN/MurJ (putative lipid II flippase)